LENVIERGVILCRSDQITPRDLMPQRTQSKPLPYLNESVYQLPFKEAKETVIKAFHRHYIEGALRQTSGNISRAAEQAGLQRQYLHRLIRDENISAESFRDSFPDRPTVT
jgi:DNA-binding NtrC family response regulator